MSMPVALMALSMQSVASPKFISNNLYDLILQRFLCMIQGDFVPTSMIFNFSNLSNKSGQTPSNGV